MQPRQHRRTDLMPRDRLPGLHGLRALAACSIVLLHMLRIPKPWVPVPDFLLPIVPSLRTGVTLFFILSAFSLLYSNTRLLGTAGWVRIYVIKRLFRIAPLFYTMLALYCWQYWHWGAPFSLGAVLANILFIFNFLPSMDTSIVWAGWTIGVEMPFYACIPMIMLTIRSPMHAWALFAACGIVSVGWRLLIAKTGWFPPLSVELSLPGNLIAFAAGILVFHMLRQYGITRAARWLLAGVSLGGLGVLSTGVAAPYGGPAHLDLLLFVLPLSALCAWQAATPSYWLASGPMQWMGERSFSLYLLHPFIVYYLSGLGLYADIDHLARPFIGNWGFVISYAATLSVLITVTALAYAIIELPGQRLGGMLIKRFVVIRRPLQPAVWVMSCGSDAAIALVNAAQMAHHRGLATMHRSFADRAEKYFGALRR